MAETGEKTAYEIDHTELVNKFRKAAAQAGVSTSGLVIDMGGGYNVLNANYLQGAVIARIEGVQPPFSPDNRLRPKDKEIRCYDTPRVIGKEEVVTVKRVYYEGSGKWTVEIEGTDLFNDRGYILRRYPAELFEQVE